ncbi:hypothetical protein B0J11DRAFT_522180 [Dendryphion nanum]|uniref:Uncharacterized protein n=1 Tax=Dendryphion nanum TaxID=256645 RepID=A0A9P9E8J8_9PLEO|nr:hypothetical protein B0J11DRAFT_522180 [Dendryphion nanum]
MSSFSITDLDSHIANLQSQLTFLASALDATDHTDPEWLASDLITLKGKTSMLSDDMRRVRKRMANEGVRVKERPANKRSRLSIEGSKRESLTNEDPGGQITPTKRADGDLEQSGIKGSANKSTEDDGGYQVQYIDVTEEVNRRLRESRLRQLMNSPITSQKRKFEALEGADDVELGDTPGETGVQDGSGLDLDVFKSPTKKIRTSGAFTQVASLNGGFRAGSKSEKDDGVREGPDGRLDRVSVKRRRM